MTPFRQLLLAALLVVAPAVWAAPDSPDADLRRHVVSLTVTAQHWSQAEPWSKNAPETRTVAAVVVPGPFLLTTADLIRDATMISVSPQGGLRAAMAHVVHVDWEVNLALLEVDRPTFLQSLAPVRIAEHAPQAGSLWTVRWREGQLEAASTRPSRVEVLTSYWSGLRHVFLLAVTDLRGGGYAEPVFSGSTLVGLIDSMENQVARIIPPEILAAYVARLQKPGTYVGFPGWSVRFQLNDGEAQAAWLGDAEGPRGVMIRRVPRGSTGCGVLQPRDVLLSLAGHDLDAQGYYQHPHYGRIELAQILALRAPGESLPARVLRAGRMLELELPLRAMPASEQRVPSYRGFGAPPYVVAGGLVFRELDFRYLAARGSDWRATTSLGLVIEYDQFGTWQSPDRPRAVFLQTVLPLAYNLGYHHVADLLVDEINGRRIRHLGDVVEALRKPVRGLHHVVFRPNVTMSSLVLDGPAMGEATRQALETYGIPEEIVLPPSPPADLGPECSPTPPS